VVCSHDPAPALQTSPLHNLFSLLPIFSSLSSLTSCHESRSVLTKLPSQNPAAMSLQKSCYLLYFGLTYKTFNAAVTWSQSSVKQLFLHCDHQLSITYSALHGQLYSPNTTFLLPHSKNYRMVWVGKDLKDDPIPWHGKGCHPPAQAAQGSIQPGLEQLQGWDVHSFSGQPVPVNRYITGWRNTGLSSSPWSFHSWFELLSPWAAACFKPFFCARSSDFWWVSFWLGQKGDPACWMTKSGSWAAQQREWVWWWLPSTSVEDKVSHESTVNWQPNQRPLWKRAACACSFSNTFLQHKILL